MSNVPASARGSSKRSPEPTEAEIDEERYWSRLEAEIEASRARPRPPRATERDPRGRPLPALGMRPLQPALPVIFRYLVKLGMPMVVVPDGYWGLVSRVEDRCPSAALTCVCGEAHTVGEGERPVECACERLFYFDRTKVWSLGRKGAAA